MTARTAAVGWARSRAERPPMRRPTALFAVAVAAAAIGGCGGNNDVVDQVPETTPPLTVPGGENAGQALTTSTTATTSTSTTPSSTTPAPSSGASGATGSTGGAPAAPAATTPAQ